MFWPKGVTIGILDKGQSLRNMCVMQFVEFEIYICGGTVHGKTACSVTVSLMRMNYEVASGRV